jgi:TatD DNase family protein
MTSHSTPSRPQWVDFHCHLDLYPDHAEIIAECERARVATLAVTTTPKAWPRNRDLTADCRHVRVALGLHPQLVAEREAEVSLFEHYLEDARYVGEVGLDAGPRFYSSFEAQQRVFDRILRACAEHGNKILTVHSVRTVSKVLTHIEKALPPDRGRVVFHWFTGTAGEARRAADAGCYFSINREMLRSPKSLKVIASLPLSRILTETDGPFVMDGDRPIRPRDMSQTVAELATHLCLPPKELAARILENLGSLVSR